ncbi:MAG: von Willebrand factor type domain, partial [Gaiellaceae bacterium]|nr:von Willebrand factor type domain [Gaiellaceae bacterium]
MLRNWLSTRARGPAIPLATTADLAGPTRRTLVLRIALAVALVVLALAASETGRTNAAAARGLLPGGGTGVLVLDVSRSIKPSSDRTIVAVLQELIHAQTRLGLVAFSDIAYELLPPGTSSRELRPLLRFFEPSATPRTGSDPVAPNPWSSSFSGGTQISLGLELARQALIRAGNPKGSILLVSDLDTAPDDVPRVAQTFNTFRNEGVK